MLRDRLNGVIEEAGIPIADRFFIKEYNHAMHDLAMMFDTAKKREIQTIVCDDATALYPLTTGCLKIEHVLNSFGHYFKYFQVRGNKEIKFAVQGTFTISELFDHVPINAMTDDEAIDSTYNKAIEEYIAAKALRKTDPTRSKELMADSAADAEIANKNIEEYNSRVLYIV
jgi:hypothetical protein